LISWFLDFLISWFLAFFCCSFDLLDWSMIVFNPTHL
jgi:hypothetical protein